LPRIFPNNGILDIEENFDLDLLQNLKIKVIKLIILHFQLEVVK